VYTLTNVYKYIYIYIVYIYIHTYRLYIDPNNKEIIYRNFESKEDVTWDNADDKKFIRICTDDIYGAAAYAANERASGNIYMDKFMCVYT
jgi:hypothetical protein